MGYTWYGIGNWDKSSLFSDQWPKSDRELAVNTLDYITADAPFHIYYMTVSGHALQTWGGNANSRAHRSLVTSAGLNYTDQNALSYIASQKSWNEVNRPFASRSSTSCFINERPTPLTAARPKLSCSPR